MKSLLLLVSALLIISCKQAVEEPSIVFENHCLKTEKTSIFQKNY